MKRSAAWLKDHPKRLVIAVLFAFCIGPTYISYQPYTFTWDDADYLQNSIKVSQILWSGSLHGLRSMISSYLRPPAMMLLGLPWGPLASWDVAGKCFITLAAAISLLAAICLYLLLRIGVRPFFLLLASICVGASLGPYPHAGEMHDLATGFMADSLFAWTTLAAMLLIPYEARTPCPVIRDAVLRGIVWASILSLGVLIKLSFLYFSLFIIPLLFLINLHHNGSRSTLTTLIVFVGGSAPSLIYLLLWGRRAFHNAMAASFGADAQTYYNPLLRFLGDAVQDSPGLVLPVMLTTAALMYIMIKRRIMEFWPDFLAFLIIIGFQIAVLVSPNRDIRFSFPTIVVVPFLAAILMSGKGHPAPRPSAVLAAVLAFCGLLAAGVPTQHRGDIQSLRRSEAVLAQAFRCSAKRVTLATNSPTLNWPLMSLAIALSASKNSIEVANLNWYDVLPVEESFRKIDESDHVVLQTMDAFSDRVLLRTGSIFREYSWEMLRPFNQRISEYEQYIRQSGYVPVRVDDDVNVYSITCRR